MRERARDWGLSKLGRFARRIVDNLQEHPEEWEERQPSQLRYRDNKQLWLQRVSDLRRLILRSPKDDDIRLGYDIFDKLEKSLILRAWDKWRIQQNNQQTVRLKEELERRFFEKDHQLKAQ
jgi:hypothetical protein